MRTGIDEFAEVPIDASGAVWLATANEAGRIPEPLLSRLTVYEIDAPDAETASAFSLWYAREGFGRVQTLRGYAAAEMQAIEAKLG